MVVNDSSRLKEARTFPQILSEAYARPAMTNSYKLYVIRYAIDDCRKKLRKTIIELQGHSAFNRIRCSDLLTQCNYITCLLVNLNHDTFQNMNLVALICRKLT